jgi:molecular chaperone GrpE
VTDADFTGGTAGPQPVQPLPGTPSGAEGADNRLADLEARLAAATAEVEKFREDWLRAKAETDNVRRRGQDDVAKAHRFGVEGFAGALLAVKDSLDAALTVENTSVESFKEGVEITARQLESVFEKFAIRVVNPQGEKFDPHRHQAISQVESDQEPNTVVTVLQKGYLLHDRVLRPALVMVAKPKNEA